MPDETEKPSRRAPTSVFMRAVWALVALAALAPAALLAYACVMSERVTTERLPILAREGLEALRPHLEADADAMQAQFPEGRVFTLAMYGAAWVNLGRRGAAGISRERAQHECRRALALLLDGESQEIFAPAGGLPHGMFYEAWSNWLQGGCLTLDVDPAGMARAGARGDVGFAASCARLADALAQSGPFVDSYPGQAWPVDSVVGAASLGLCSLWLGGRYHESLQNWVTQAREHVDATTGLLPHLAAGGGPRASSASIMNALLPDVDEALAGEQYQRFRETFDAKFLGLLPAIAEYPRGVDGPSDVDSGPVLLGVSASSTVVGIAAARAQGDGATALALRRAVEAVGFPMVRGEGRVYAGGYLPVGDAFLAWASVHEPWTHAAAAGTTHKQPAGWGAWRLVSAVATLALATLSLAATRRCLGWQQPAP